MEEKKGLTIKDLLIRLILIIIFIFLLIWLFPMPDLKPLNSQIFLDNIDRMKDVAKSYYTIERLPKDINSSKKMTLREMIKNNLILPLMDSNGKYCNEDDSYVEIKKLENEYIIKVNLSCTDKKDYIIEHYGCYDICSDTCKMLETTTKTNKQTKKKTTFKTTTPKITTTKNNGKVYEYEYYKNVCTEKLDKYECPSGYNLVGYNGNYTCIKKGSKVVSYPAQTKEVEVTSTDTKDAKRVESKSTSVKSASCSYDYLTTSITAGYDKTIYNAQKSLTTQKVTANKTTSSDVKAATKTTTTASYKVVQNYDVIDADKYAKGYEWSYVSTTVSRDGNLGYENGNEKLVLVDSWSELACESATACSSTITYYKYYKYSKKVTGYTYSCSAYPGYTLYNTTKCRKKTTQTKTCPDSSYTDTGTNCVKTNYSCSKYSSDYKSDGKGSCVKTINKYSCPSGTKATSDPKYCSKEVTTYSCPSGTQKLNSTQCVKYDYYCPKNTSTKTYTLNGSKCTVKTKVKVCSCSNYKNAVQSADKLQCTVTDTSYKWSCSDNPGYTLNGSKCVKTITTKKTNLDCSKYPGTTLNGEYCVKTVDSSDSKKATPKYSTSCQNEYKWSTSTSLDGWTYTGKKRQIN